MSSQLIFALPDSRILLKILTFPSRDALRSLDLGKKQKRKLVNINFYKFSKFSKKTFKFELIENF